MGVFGNSRWDGVGFVGFDFLFLGGFEGVGEVRILWIYRCS